MNIFALDNDPVKAAQMMCDKHVVKMILETRELLELASRKAAGNLGAMASNRHKNHPCTKWAGESYDNFYWLREHGKALCQEYTYRYGKVHKLSTYFDSATMPTEWLKNCARERTPFVQCMLPEYFDPDPIVAYRNYYMGAKTKLLKYTRRAPPQWMQDMQLGEHKDNATI